MKFLLALPRLKIGIILCTIPLFFLNHSLTAQQVLAGPMLGYNTMREVAIWIQLDNAFELQLQYWEQGNENQKMLSAPVSTYPDKAFAAKLIATNLEPGTTYQAKVMANGKELNTGIEFTTQSLWQWRNPAPDFSFLTGSCVYMNEPAYDRPGDGYGGDYEIFNTMSKESAEFMMWLGDNTYLREVDWETRSGIYHRQSHTRQEPALQPFLKSMHHYAIWDDHDFGPNDSDRSYALKDITKEAFMNFWPNPNYGVGGSEGITGTFSWNDCQFFLLDNRWYRSPKDKNGQILGDLQIQWLIDALRGSKASFKFICVGGQFISDLAAFENHANYPKERKRIIKLLDQYKIPGVVFLSGDRHHSEISKLSSRKGQVYYDVTSSPITSGSYDHREEKNTNRMPGTIIDVRSYAQIHVTGETDQRKCVVLFKDKEGKILVERELVFSSKRKGK